MVHAMRVGVGVLTRSKIGTLRFELMCIVTWMIAAIV